MKRCRGYSLIEVMLAVAIGIGIIATVIAASAAVRGDVTAGRIGQGVNALKNDVQDRFGGAHGPGYFGLNARQLHARSDAGSRVFVDSPDGGTYLIGRAVVSLHPSMYVLDASDNSVSTGRAGDSFAVRMTGLTPAYCSDLAMSLGPDATRLEVSSDNSNHVLGTRSRLNLAEATTACKTGTSPVLTAHYN